MSEELLHAAEIDPTHHEPARKGVAEIVPAEVLDAGALEGGREDA
jgi:hypothetical protein